MSIAGHSSYEIDTTGATSLLSAGRVGAGPVRYACLADRDDLKKVEVLWDQPIH